MEARTFLKTWLKINFDLSFATARLLFLLTIMTLTLLLCQQWTLRAMSDKPLAKICIWVLNSYASA